MLKLRYIKKRLIKHRQEIRRYGCDDGNHHKYYLSQPDQRKQDFGVTSASHDFAEMVHGLLSRTVLINGLCACKKKRPFRGVRPAMLSPAGLRVYNNNYYSQNSNSQVLINILFIRSEFLLQRIIAYFDGFNLYYGLKSKGWKRYYWLNPYLLAENLLKTDQQLDRVKYFTARISQNYRDPDKHRRQAIWLEAIEMLENTSVFYGHYLSKPQKCNNCGLRWTTHEEKMTDVNIAVELLCDAYDGAFDAALLFSADSDLTTPVQTILRRFSDKRIIVICPPGRQSKELEGVASASLRLGRKILQNSQLNDEIAKPDGFVLKRPIEWR